MYTRASYTSPDKALVSDLIAELRLLANQRLAQQLRFLQRRYSLTDDDIAERINECAAVTGIRGRDGDAHAPISTAKITRFTDKYTRPQTQTLEQMTAFFEATLNAPPFLYWPEVDDAIAALHEARRFQTLRTPKSLCSLAKGWLFADVYAPTCVMAVQLTPLTAAPVILARGRVMCLHERDDHSLAVTDFVVHGYASLTSRNLNLHLRGAHNRQVIICLDVDAGPFDEDSEEAPWLLIRQARLNLPPECGDGLHTLFTATRRVRSKDEYALHLTERNVHDPNAPQAASFFGFGVNEWEAISTLSSADPQIKALAAPLDADLAGLSLLEARIHAGEDDAGINAATFGQAVGDLKHLIQIVENKLAERY